LGTRNGPQMTAARIVGLRAAKHLQVHAALLGLIE
jgi:hypothetical protein